MRVKEAEAIAKRTQKLIEFACRETGYVSREEISEFLFGCSRKITRKSLLKLAEKYGWGLLEGVESKIGLTYELYLKLHGSISTRIRSKRNFSPAVAKFVNRMVSIAESFEEEVGLKPDLGELGRLMEGGFSRFPAKDFNEILCFLAERNVFVVKAKLPALSGLAVKNFIAINDVETKERKLWSLFHELLHLIKKETGFRTVNSPEEREHEEEVAKFFFEGTAPELQDPLTFKEVQKIYKQLNLPVSSWSLAKWYKQKGLLIDNPFFSRRKKKKDENEGEVKVSLLRAHRRIKRCRELARIYQGELLLSLTTTFSFTAKSLKTQTTISLRFPQAPQEVPQV